MTAHAIGRRTRGLSALLWCGLLLALPLAWTVRNPMLLRWRPVATPLVLSVAVAVLLVLLVWQVRAHRHWPPLYRQGWLAIFWLGVLLLASVQEGLFHWREQQVMAASDVWAKRLGAHMVIGVGDLAGMKDLAVRGLVGGVFISASNVKGKSIEAIRAEIAALQTLRGRAGLPSLLVSTDQEGGMVSRMSPPLPAMPALADVIATAALQELDGLAFTYGAEQGRELARLGVNVNFAPLADLASRHEEPLFDFRSQINHRAIHADPARVSAAVVGYARGLDSAGVRATLKHFPGLGRVRADTHVMPAMLSASVAELERSDWLPFRSGLGADVGVGAGPPSKPPLLMVGHATLTQVDANRPASRSEKVIQQIVRQRWGHQGVLITDDLSMGAVLRHGLCSAGVEAINAGIDLLLISYDRQQYFEVFHCLLQAARKGELNLQRLVASDLRVAQLTEAFKERRTMTGVQP